MLWCLCLVYNNKKINEQKTIKECSIDMCKKYPHAIVAWVVVLAFILGLFIWKGHDEMRERGGKHGGRGGYQDDDRGYGPKGMENPNSPNWAITPQPVPVTVTPLPSEEKSETQVETTAELPLTATWVVK